MRAWAGVAVVVACGASAREPSASLDVPQLPAAAETLSLDDGDTIVDVAELAAIPDRLADRGTFAVRRGLPAAAALDAFARRAVTNLRLVVLVGDRKRAIAIERPKARGANVSRIAVVRIGASALVLDGVAIAPAELRAKVGDAAVALEIDPDVTVQQLAEIAALLGGTLTPVPLVHAPRKAPR
jgi:hypothetical protein